jgi:hypothetical protein
VTLAIGDLGGTGPGADLAAAFNGIVIAPLNGRPAVAAANQVGQNVTVWTRAIGATDFTPAVPGMVGGSVPATLALTLGGSATLGAFTPGVAKDYTATTTATVISSAGDAAVTVSDPGHLMNGTFALPQPLVVQLGKSSWTAPVADDPVTITFKQHIDATDALRTGSYSRTLTFTLSTATP